MINLQIEELLYATGGKWIGKPVDAMKYIKGVCTDSRKIADGEVFIALIGEKMDGHDYLQQVFQKGALLAIVSREPFEEDKSPFPLPLPMLLVENTLTALNGIAGFYRQKFSIPVIGVTGSTGKTSTKEMIASVLSEKYNVHRTKMNYNNEIGLPLTLMDLLPEHEAAVLEMGMNHPGEIKRLAAAARPTIGVITNIGTAHIENLKTQQNILDAKMEITYYFESGNCLIVNGDDEYLKTVHNQFYEVRTVSLYNEGDYRGIEVQSLGEEGVLFQCMLAGELRNFRLNVPGVHNVYNALMGIAIGERLGLSWEQIARGIQNYRPVGNRMDIQKLEDGLKLICDYYNANPDSMRSSLNVLGEYSGRKIAVLGDMYELGEYSVDAHSEIGSYALACADVLVAVGSDTAAGSYYSLFSKQKEAYYFQTKEEAGSFLKTYLKPADIVLIKASNGMKMGELADRIKSDRERI